MKQLSIRFYLILALVLIITVAILSSCTTGIVLMESNNQTQQESTSLHTLIADTSHWSDPVWQKTLGKSSSSSTITLVLRNTYGKVIYQSGSYNATDPMYQEVLVTDGTHQLGTASIYQCTPAARLTLYTIYIGLSALLLTLSAVVWFFASMILKPLNAIKTATHQVMRNELDFHFPTSRVREVAEAFHSFITMGEALRTSLVRQAEIEQERRLFISAIAHDLRTPLFSLRGYLEGLSMGVANTPEKANRYIEVCQTKAASLERLVADLFSYTQTEYLEQLPRQESLEIGELIHHVLESLQLQAQNRKVSFTVDHPSIPCIVQADTHLLIRVFENILDNALRYTPVNSSIHIHWHPETDHLIFSITDMGQGVASADLPHLFTPFYRGEPSRSRRTGGAGLGLAIAQRILRAHGGDLTATNASSGGAMFTGSLSISHSQKNVARLQPDVAHSLA